MKELQCLIATLILTFTLSAWGEDPQRTIKIGGLLSLTGNWAELSRNIQQGMRLAVEEINAKGGLLEHPISLHFEDTDEEKSGGKAISAYRSLRRRGIKLFIGPIGAPGFLSLSPIAMKDDIVMITPSTPGSFYKDSKKFFSSGGDNFVTTKAMAVRAYQQGARRIAIFGSTQPWEQRQATTFRDEFIAAGGTIVCEVSPEADQAVFDMEALRIVKSEPEAVFFAIFNHIAPAAKALKRLRYSGKKYVAALDSSHLTGSGDGLQDAEVFLFRSPAPKFMAQYSNRWGERPGIFADSGYDAVYAIASAIEDSGSQEPDAIIHALGSIQTSGSSGARLTFDRDGLLKREIELHTVNGETIVSREQMRAN